MSKINLLPWREELRKVRNRIFYAILGASAVLSVVFVLLISSFINTKIEVQNANSTYLDEEFLHMKGEITEIKGLQDNKKQLLERMSVIGSLQNDRYTIVKLLDLLPRILPMGIYLTEVNRSEVNESFSTTDTSQPSSEKGKLSTNLIKKYVVVIKGVALTNGSISTFLKSLGEVKWISGVKLNEVGINKDNSSDQNKEKKIEGLDFQLEFTQLVTADQ